MVRHEQMTKISVLLLFLFVCLTSNVDMNVEILLQSYFIYNSIYTMIRTIETIMVRIQQL